MAVLELNQVWLHDAADLSVHIRFKARNIVGTPERRVRLDEYASGRTRLITTPIRRTQVRFDALRVPREDIDQLEAWLGRLLLYRDPRGRKLFGFLSQLPTTERIHTELADISGIEFTSTTDTEEV